MDYLFFAEAHYSVLSLIYLNLLQERDLSPVTDKLWKKFYEAKFGVKSVEVVVERMGQFKVKYNWRQLYQVLVTYLMCFYRADALHSITFQLLVVTMFGLPLLEKA